MTRDEILAMPPGREMDALVAEKVMGEKMPIYVHMKEHIMYDEKSTAGNWYCSQLYEHGDVCEWHPRPFSTDISAAWEVVEKFAKDTYLFPELRKSSMWVFRIWRNNPTNKDDFGWLAEAYAPTAPLAICRAALLAVMEAE